jgi:succinyl-diaminopimelate desuccinylase
MAINEEEIVKFTQDLVKTRSVLGNETAVSRLVKEKLSEHGIESELFGKDEKRQGIIARIGEGEKKIILNGHLDTVPEGDADKWKFPPFEARVEGDKLYGRGAYDMKSGLAAAVFAFINLSKQKLNGEVILGLVHDEESGKHTGTKEFLEKLRSDACIVAEPMHKGEIVIGSRGILRLEASVKGETAHTGNLRHKGINAIQKASKFIQELQKLKPSYNEHPLFPEPRITPSIIQGGIAQNIVPDLCKVTIDCRLSYGQNKENLLETIHNLIETIKKEDKDFSADVDVLAYVPPVIADEKEKIIVSSLKAFQEEGIKPELNVSGGVTDASIFNMEGIPSVVFGCEGDGAHKENEFVLIPSIPKAVRVFEKTVFNFFETR